MLIQVKSNEIISHEITFDEIVSHEIKFHEIKSDDIKLDEIKSDEIKSDDIKFNEIKSDAIKSDEITPHEVTPHGVTSSEIKMLPPQAEKKMRCWIRTRHLICSGHFFILETVEYTTIERFSECVKSLGGTLISVEPINKIWMGANRKVILYQAKASLHTPHHTLKQYWIKYGGFYTRFDERC